MSENPLLPTHDQLLPPTDEGGLRPPPGLSYWRRVWWWIDFVILVKLARLRFVAILVAIGFVITQWDTLIAWYEKWTRPAAVAGASNSDTEYFCPMHPAVIRDNSRDKCPVCFMPLSKRKKGEVQDEVLPSGVVSRVQLSPYRVALAGVHTWKVDYLPLEKQISAVGFIEFNERGQRTVSSRVAGRIDKLLVNETGAIVEQGAELASLYSPELIVTMQNLLGAQQAKNKSLLQDNQTRLDLLGISQKQIDEVLQTGKSNTQLIIRSPIKGHVIKKYVREGDYVQEGMPLYDVADLSSVWIQAQIYEDDLSFLPTDQEHSLMTDKSLGPTVTATTRSFPSEPFTGRLAFIYPHVDQETRTITVRFELANPGHKLRPGGTATVNLTVKPQEMALFKQASLGEAATAQLALGRLLSIPESAVIDTGSQKIVYREASSGIYEGTLVTLGPRMVGVDQVSYFPVLSGLASGERIVTGGAFLVDAETRLNPAAGSIYFGGGGMGKSGSTTVTSVRPSTPEDGDAKVKAALEKLSPADRAMVQAQQTCPILADSVLGSMGTPVKLAVGGEFIFLCCNGCKASALAKPEETIAKVHSLRQQKRETPRQELPAANSPPNSSAEQGLTLTDEEKAIQEALALLSPADRKLAEKQKLCVISEESPLGSMGVPIKVLVEGVPVLLCCEGCRDLALKKPQETLAKLKKLIESTKP